MNATAQDIIAAKNAVLAIAECIRELGSVPSGHLYARVMDKMSLQTYTSIIDVLKRADVVKEVSHELIWIGGGK